MNIIEKNCSLSQC